MTSEIDRLEAWRDTPEEITQSQWDDREGFYSCAEVAAQLGISRRRVQQLAKSRHVGRDFAGSLLFYRSDIEALRHRPTGRPHTR